jgi:protein-histidine pros-kinase
MALIDPDGAYVQVNDAMCRILGYPQNELVGTSVVESVHPEDVEAHRAQIQELRGGGRPSHMAEIRYRHRDGHLVWLRLHASVIGGRDGELRNFLFQVEDITDSKLAIAELVASELRKAEMIDAMLDGMIVIDGNSVITEFNPAASRMFGYSRHEAVGADLAELLVPQRFRDVHRGGLQRNLEGGVVGLSRRVEMIAQRANGSEFAIELSLSRFEFGGAPFFSASIRDLSDRDRLAESRALLTQVLEASPVMLFAFDIDGTITLAEGRSLTGLTTDAAVGGNVFDLVRNIPEAMEHIQRGLAGESFVGQIDLPAHDLWLEVRYDPIRDHSDRIIGISGMAADISDRVRGQAARQESDAKSQLVAVVNHEIRTPLNSILGFAELLQQPRTGPLNEKQTRYLSNVDSAGRHLLALVNDLLDLSKIGAGEMGLELVDLNLAEIIEQAAGQVQPLVESRGLEIRIDAGGQLGVKGDRRRVLQILWNLLSNAIRHTPTGGIISVSGAATARGVAIVVADTGVGIPTDQLERIFEDYKQVGVATDGTGLGLPLSRRLAQLMNGDISVVSEVGVGSTFTISLPASTAR